MTAFLSTTFAPHGSAVTELLPRIAELGVKGVELGSIHRPEPDLSGVLSGFQFRYLVHNFFPPPDDRFVVNIASDSAPIRDRSIEHAKGCIRFCREIGAELYTFHPGFVADPKSESRSTESYDFEFGTDLGSSVSSLQEGAFERFLESARILADYAVKHGVAVAVETQGSIGQPDKLLLQRPEELMIVMNEFDRGEIDFNLNIGHLPLAATTFGFDAYELVKAVSDRTVALEVSHNDGLADDHGPLVPGAWYWDLIADPKLAHAVKIFEGRDLSLEDACAIAKSLEAGERPGEPPLPT